MKSVKMLTRYSNLSSSQDHAVEKAKFDVSLQIVVAVTMHHAKWKAKYRRMLTAIILVISIIMLQKEMNLILVLKIVVSMTMLYRKWNNAEG